MGKVIISFLGTGGYSDKNKSRGQYRKANYSLENENYTCEFVSEALFRHYNADKIIYIGTLKSMWDVVYDNKTFIQQPNDEKWEHLVEIIEKSNYKTSLEISDKVKDVFSNTIITPIILKYGLNDVENEFNISRLFHIEELLKYGDKLFLDISHGFRSLPIVLINVLNFIIENSSKKLEIAKISYGMFEVSDEMNDISPIVNLNILKELNSTLTAAHEFSEYGNAYLFSKLIENTNKSMSKILLDFSYSKGLNHIYDLKNKINQFQSFKYEDLSTVQRLTIPKTVNDFVKRFDKARKDSHYQYEIAKWMYDNKEFGASAIALIESLITKICELQNIDPIKIQQRDCAKNLILFSGKVKQNLEKELKKSRVSQTCKKEILHKAHHYKPFHEVWGETNKIRKSVAHSIGTKLSVTKMISDLEKNIVKSENLIY